MKIIKAWYHQNPHCHRRLQGQHLLFCLFMLAVLFSAGCTHHVSKASVQHSVSQSSDQSSDDSYTIQLPVVERNHQILAVGKYILPERIILPKTVSPLPVADALLSKTSPHDPLFGVQIYFPEKDTNAVMTWARAFRTVVSHTGVALWHTKRGWYLERSLPPATDYKWINQLPSLAVAKNVWSIYGTFFTDKWDYGPIFSHGEMFVGRTTYPLPPTKKDLSLALSFFKRPTRVWLPLHEEKHCIVGVGKYRLPSPIIIPPGITPLPSALVIYAPSSSPTLPGLKIFFPPEEEGAVFRWAKSSVIIENSPEARWQPNQHGFFTKSTGSANGVSSSWDVVPSAPPLAWFFNGNVPAKNGQYVLNFSGVNVVSAKDLRSDASTQYLFSISQEDYVGESDDFGRDSPLKGEHRHICLEVSY